MLRWVCKAIQILTAVALLAGSGHIFAYAAKAETYTINGKTMVGDQLVRRAVIISGSTNTPRPDQLDRSAILLDLALQMDETNAEIWRLRYELAELINDNEGHIDALTRYCDLRPTDDAAQLRLVFARISRLQTMQDRVAMAQRVLTSKATENFTPAFRSRLASLVAGGAAEIGDDKLFRQYLAQALQLDATNRNAAEMQYEFITRRQSSNLEVAMAMMQLIRTAPFDESIRIPFARFLLAQGMYKAAAQQLSVANRFNPLVSDSSALFDWCLSLAASGDSNSAITLLNLAEAQNAETPPIEQDVTTPTSPQTPPVEVGLDLDLELLRLTILDRGGWAATADGAFGRITQKLQAKIDQGHPQAQQDLAWLAALFNRHDKGADLLGDIPGDQKENESWIQLVRGWTALHENQLQKAAHILKPLIKHDPFAAYGYSKTLTTDEEQTERHRLLRSVIQMSPGHIVGLFAAIDHVQENQTIKLSNEAAQIAKIYDQWPRSIREPNNKEAPLLKFDVVISPKTASYLQPLWATVHIGNLTGGPLAIGQPGAIPANVMIVPSRQLIGDIRDIPPIIVNMNRQLRLDAGQTITAQVRLDWSVMGILLDRAPTDRIGLSFASLLAPIPTGSGPPEIGPVGAIDNDRFVERYGFAPTTEQVGEWINSHNNPDPIERLRALARICNLAPRLADNEEMQDYSEQIYATLNRIFPNLAPHEQAWILFFLSNDEAIKQSLGIVHDTAQRSDDPLVRIAYTIMQVNDPSSSVLNAGMRHSNLKIKRFSEATRTGIIKNREAEIEFRKQQKQLLRKQQDLQELR